MTGTPANHNRFNCSEEVVAKDKWSSCICTYLLAHYEPASGGFSITSSYTRYISNVPTVLDSYTPKKVCCLPHM